MFLQHPRPWPEGLINQTVFVWSLLVKNVRQMINEPDCFECQSECSQGRNNCMSKAVNEALDGTFTTQPGLLLRRLAAVPHHI